ncbi:MAG: TetR family transcriptional regulator [Actinomycetia bacterium]|nr:TetR family transcriptional regulator [Actinomycetes bacterium]
MSAEERRGSVIRAAMSEFAHGGYKGTSTEAIARRVGVSQPYLFRLFPNKQAIFLAASLRCIDITRQVIADAADGVPQEEKADAIANAYKKLLLDDPESLLMQMQTYVAVASAEAVGDHEFGEAVRERWQEMWDTVHLALGADVDETKTFMAYGMLVNTLFSLGYPAGHRNWEGFHDSARPA